MLSNFAVHLPQELSKLLDRVADMSVDYPQHEINRAYMNAWQVGRSKVNEQQMRDAVLSAVEQGGKVETMANHAAQAIEGTFGNVLLSLKAKYVGATFLQEIHNRCLLINQGLDQAGFYRKLFDQDPTPGMYMPHFEPTPNLRQIFIMAPYLDGLSEIGDLIQPLEFILAQDITSEPALVTIITRQITSS